MLRGKRQNRSSASKPVTIYSFRKIINPFKIIISIKTEVKMAVPVMVSSEKLGLDGWILEKGCEFDFEIRVSKIR